MGDPTKSDIGSVIEITGRLFAPELMEISDGEVAGSVLLVPNDKGMVAMQVKPLLAPFRERPERREGTIRADDLDSFIALVNRDKRPESIVFAHRGKLGAQPGPSLTAVLDFHKPNAGAPAFGKDRIHYAFPVSDEWAAWTGHDGKAHAMDQHDFATWLEDHIFDIGEPGAAGPTTMAFADKLTLRLAGPSELMGVSRGLEVRIDQTVKQVVNLSDGTGELRWAEKNTDASGAPLKVPSAFHLLIPIFRGGALYSIPVRLRYRAGGGRVTWWYEMHRADLFYDDAIHDVIERVRASATPAAPKEEGGVVPPAGTGLPVVLGAPAG